MVKFFRARVSDEQTPASYEDLRADFTAAVSHELRTPLARVLALLESAQLSPREASALIEQAKQEVRHTSELIDEILFLGGLERGAVASAGATRVDAIAAAVFSSMRDRAEQAGVELRADVEPRLEVPLRRRLTRVIVENLAENAIRHAGPDAVFTLIGRRERNVVVLIGSDTGSGVDRGELPRLFERFYRGDRARGSEGTGLGLAVVKHVVSAVGGSATAEIGPDGGLVVRCAFPA
jgi:signal transduction histidine kinase